MKYILGNEYATSSSTMTFLASTNYAYLTAKPWWMAFFSLTLLLRDAIVFNGRLTPGFCPYRPIPSIADQYNVEQYIASQLKTLTRKETDVGLLYTPELKPLTEEYENSYGYFGLTLSEDIYTISKDERDDYHFKWRHMYDYDSLSAAVIISVILASIVGIIGLYALVVSMKYLFEYFASESDHIYAYIKENINEEVKAKILTNAEFD